MRVRGHSRSPELVPCESFGTVSYSQFIVTMVVSLDVSEIYSVKEWRDLHSGLFKVVENGAVRYTIIRLSIGRPL